MPELDAVSGSVQASIPYLIQNTFSSGVKETKKSKGTKRSEKSSFFSILKNGRGAEVEETQTIDGTGENSAISALLDELHSSGETLLKHPVSSEIQRYKSSVRNFVRYVLQHGFTVKESDGILNRLKPRYRNKAETSRKSDELNKRNRYKTVAVIDQKLEGLAAAIMSGQTSQFALLTRIDEITGLVINLLR